MPENKSRVLRFMLERVEALEYDPDFQPEKKITVRLPESVVDNLDEIAAKLSMTRTSCAEHLLSVVINEASAYAATDPIISARKGIDASLLTKIEDEQATKADFDQMSPAKVAA